MYNNYTYYSLYKYAMKNKQGKSLHVSSLIQDNSGFRAVD